VPRYSQHQYVNIDDLKYYCFWCDGDRNKLTPDQHKSVPTYIEFDLALHLFEAHKLAMVKLPIGKGSMDMRIEYAVGHCKAMTLYLRKHPERWTMMFNIVSREYSRQQEEHWQRQQQYQYQYQQWRESESDEYEEREGREDWEEMA
jgi:hypothetical protein